MLLLFEHSFVLNQSNHVVSAVTVEMALIWTTPLGLTWSLTLMPFSATGTFLPLFHPPPPSIDSKIKSQMTPKTFEDSNHSTPLQELKACITLGPNSNLLSLSLWNSLVFKSIVWNNLRPVKSQDVGWGARLKAQRGGEDKIVMETRGGQVRWVTSLM